ncbi:MAG: NrsF family protein [Vicinamibacterales bacterium]
MSDRDLAATIRALSDDPTPVTPLPPLRTRAMRWSLLAALSVGAGVGLFGARRDLAAAVFSPLVATQLALLLVGAGLSVLVALRLSVPGAAGRRTAALALVSAAWVALVAGWHVATGGTLAALVAEPLHPSCAQTIATVALVPAVALAWMVRRGLALDPTRAAIAVGVAAASIGALGVSLTCPIVRLPHLVVAHALPAAVCAALCAGLASSLLRRCVSMGLVALVAIGVLSAPLAAQAPQHNAAPSAPFEVAGSTGGYQDSATLLTFLRTAEGGTPQPDALAGRGPLLIGLSILAGGFLLNLTPCVLPMIPINLAIIGAGRAATSRRRGWLLGGVYGGAMALVYGVLGAIVVVTAGTFGVLNASPWFNAAIAVLFVVLGLAMFDVFTVDLSRWSSAFAFDTSAKGSIALASSMGGVAALLAGACVAPVVIQVVALSSQLYAGGSRSALALPLILGVGMGLPWPFAGAGLTALPKPGAWMTRVKQALGVCILITAAYYGYEAVQLLRPPTVAAGVKDGWYASLDEGLAAASREGKPVFLDVWATWCKNCVVMDATTFKDPEVRDALDRFVKVRFQAENIESPAASALLDRLDSVGLPTYAVLRPSVERDARASR